MGNGQNNSTLNVWYNRIHLIHFFYFMTFPQNTVAQKCFSRLCQKNKKKDKTNNFIIFIISQSFLNKRSSPWLIICHLHATMKIKIKNMLITTSMCRFANGNTHIILSMYILSLLCFK